MAESSNSKIGIVILAAGSSSRMGSSKQLLEVNRKPLLLIAVEAALQTQVSPIVVVLGANEKAHRKIIENLPIHIYFNELWPKGMGNSLKKGLTHLLAIEPSLDAVITMLCDQPLIGSQDLKLLIEKFRETKAKIVASFYNDTAGVPALFDKFHFSDLCQVDDGQGAKKIIQQYLASCLLVRLPHAAVDLDTPEDYKSFIQN
jgi:molybdenum cofactor cytidylyltransferase